ncbi:MAG: PepSY domain-containing protein [Arenicella sp.]|nr:PepSY domain-containing protein [Arenicella sp.]
MASLVSKEFREAMGWLHTWLGVALGAILFAIFWTGSLTVFDKEIDHWMKPELRLAQQENVSLDRVVLPKLASFEPALGSDVWISPPRDRIPAIRMLYHDKNDNKHEIMLDPKTGEKLDLTDSHAGTDFFFRFHFMLHMPGLFGYLLVGIAALGMMVLVISGVFIHRKFFQNFFTFRPKKNLLRSTLDFHNLTAIIGLPFYFLLPLSGLFIFATVFFPWPVEVNYDGNVKSFKADLAGYQQFSVEPSGQTNLYIKTLDQLIIDAEQIWKTKEGQHSSKADWVGILIMAMRIRMSLLNGTSLIKMWRLALIKSVLMHKQVKKLGSSPLVQFMQH